MPDVPIKIPKVVSFNSLKRKLKKHHILWEKRRGKGGHGAFVGPDKNKNVQCFPLPSNQHTEVRKVYIQGILRRFQLEPIDVFE